MARSLSAATRLKISRSLKGNKNAFSGGPKKKLSTRDKIANINAATKAKKANLSSDQIARRQSVAKRLRAQARREEALGGGVPEVLKTNEQAKAESGVTRSRGSSGSIEKVKERARQTARENNQRREAETAKQRGREASAPRAAKQNLNAPQKPAEQHKAALSPAQRRRQQRSKFEADQAKARQADIKKFGDQAKNVTDMNSGKVSGYGRSQGAVVRDVPISGRGSRGGKTQFDKWQADLAKTTTRSEAEMDLRAGERGTKAQADAFRKAERQAKPKSPQSDTGTDRSGTFTNEVPVKTDWEISAQKNSERAERARLRRQERAASKALLTNVRGQIVQR